MNDETTPPSVLGTFLKGAASGLISGVLMASCIFLVSLVPAFGLSIGPWAAAGMAITTTLFTGIMALKRTFFDSPGTHNISTREGTQLAALGTLAQQKGVAVAPTIAPSAPAPTYEQLNPRSNSWAERTGTADAPSRIQAILDNGSMSDQSRAAALLAERTQAAQNGTSIA